MNKLFASAVLALGVLGIGSLSAEAASVRSAKGSTTLAYRTASSEVGISSSPATLFAVVLSTGASGEYVAIFDTNTVTGITAEGTTQLKQRVFYGSTSANTTVTFDPPMFLQYGLFAGNSAVTGSALFLWEPGRAGNE